MIYYLMELRIGKMLNEPIKIDMKVLSAGRRRPCPRPEPRRGLDRLHRHHRRERARRRARLQRDHRGKGDNIGLFKLPQFNGHPLFTIAYFPILKKKHKPCLCN